MSFMNAGGHFGPHGFGYIPPDLHRNRERRQTIDPSTPPQLSSAPSTPHRLTARRPSDHSPPSSTRVGESPSSPRKPRRKGLLVVADRVITGTRGRISEEDERWIGRYGKLELAGECKIKGYALHAVAQWVVDRSRLIHAVVSITGNQSDEVSMYLLCPGDDLSEVEGTQEIESAVKRLRKDNARPIETEWGIVMVTSLPSLRQDLQVTNISDGDYRLVQEDLYVKINLRRFGCAPRSSLSLDPPSPAVQYKLCSTYRLPLLTPSQPFIDLVLELVRLIQVALFHFGLYGVEEEEEQDGLLCDRTMEAVRGWKGEMSWEEEGEGEEVRNILLDAQGPAIVAALLSVVTSVRYKLVALDVDRVPRDPFYKLRDFQNALLSFQRINISKINTPSTHLSSSLIELITAAYVRDRQHDGTKLTRLLRHQVSAAGAGLASNLNVLHRGSKHDDDGLTEDDSLGVDGRSPGTNLPSSSSGSGLSPDIATTSLEAFVKAVLSNAKEKDAIGLGRIKNLWSGRISKTMSTALDWKANRPRDPESRDIESIENVVTPERVKEPRTPGYDGRSRTLRGMTSRTGHALKDGITGWARKGTIFGDTSDSEAPTSAREMGHRRMQSASAPSSHRGTPLPHVMRDDEPTRSSPITLDHPGVFSNSLASRDDRRRHTSHSAPSQSQRPALSSVYSFGSDTYAGGTSDINSSDADFTRTPRPPISEMIPFPAAQPEVHHAPVRPTPLVRMVSAGARAHINDESLEFVHEGHGTVALEAHLKATDPRKGLIRRATFTNKVDYLNIERIPSKHLAVDVALCEVVWQMRKREAELRARVKAMESLEKALLEATDSIVIEAKARRQRVNDLRSDVEILTQEPIVDLSIEVPIDDQETISIGNSRRRTLELSRKTNQLQYSTRELDRHLEGLERTKREVEGFDRWLEQHGEGKKGIEVVPEAGEGGLPWYSRLWR